ncbi:hypothetical protein VNI00_018463 [Paramarasmius palmivorus]|uniref:Uncharacterized protein n=1 Tax=Paramarasmius palmivorus TaxID=297713 RepID=A0AAW0AZA4_9AGAR
MSKPSISISQLAKNTVQVHFIPKDSNDSDLSQLETQTPMFHISVDPAQLDRPVSSIETLQVSICDHSHVLANGLTPPTATLVPEQASESQSCTPAKKSTILSETKSGHGTGISRYSFPEGMSLEERKLKIMDWIVWGYRK